MSLITEKQNNNPIFVGGASRSGTTLIRVILDSHPRIYCGPELAVGSVWFQLYKKMQRHALSGYLSHNSGSIQNLFKKGWLSLTQQNFLNSTKQRLAEKTPTNCFHFESIHEIFPDSPIIHVIRDGRDVVCSLLSQKWIDLSTQQIPDYTIDPVKACELWKNMVSAGLHSQATLADKYIELRYEDLIEDPESTLKNLMLMIHEDYYPELLEFYKTDRNLADEASAKQVNKKLYSTSKSRWKRDFNKQLAEIFQQICGDLLIQLGYENDNRWVAQVE